MVRRAARKINDKIIKKDQEIVKKKKTAAATKAPRAPREDDEVESPPLKVEEPDSEPIRPLRIKHVYSMHPHGHNRDETDPNLRKYSDVRRLVDEEPRTLWRYRFLLLDAFFCCQFDLE